MKKALLLFVVAFFLGNIHFLKAQCYGYVKYDKSANANGNSTFNLTTAHPDELVLIAYDGWPGGYGNGPVTVDGNSATFVTSTYSGYYSGTAQVYYYSAPLAGTHTIVCTETGYNSPYYLNLAAAFYDSATCTPLSGANITMAENAVSNSGITNTTNITTTTPNELVFSTAIFNTGISNPYSIADTGATATATMHVSIGLDANVGYTNAATAGTYTVSESDPNTCVSCGGAMILVAIIPGPCGSAFTLNSSVTQPSCLNDDGKISLTTTGGTPPFTYVWSPNVSTTANATGLSAATYTVTVTSSDGTLCSTVRDSFRLVGATTIMSSKDSKCSPNNTGTATITILNGKTPYTYTWSDGQTTSTATGLTTGEYLVTVKDGVGCIVHDSVAVVNYPSPTITSYPVSDSECYASGVLLTASGGISYNWAPAAGLSCTHCASPTAMAASTTVYTVTGTDSDGCTNTATSTIKVIPLSKVIVSGRDTICLGSSTVLTATGANSYVWNPGGNTGSTFTARAPVTIVYTVTGTSNGCTKDTTVKITVVPVPRPVIHASKDSVCQGDTLTLSASGGTLYHWAPGGQSSATIHVTLSNATTYTLYASGGTCEDSATQTIKVIKLLKAAAKATPDTVCPNTLVNIIAAGTGGNVTYSWNTGATTSGIPVRDTVTTTYTVTVHGTCDDTVIPVTVYVVPLPSIKVKGDHFECAGAEDTLTVSSITNPTTYSWSNGETGTRITPTINGAQIYTVTAMNSLGCTVTDTFSVKEQSYPQVSLNYPTACGSGELSIIATASGNGPFTYKWSTGGTYDTVNVYIDNDKTVYTVTVSNGCKVSVVDTVIEDNPQMFACCDAKIYLGGDTELVASGLEITNYQWTPANSGLSCYTCPNPIASPSVTTTYTVSGKDSAGCPIERTITITVETPCNNFIVPNVFTPTNAGALGLDNILYIQATNFSSWSLIIYDRWGHEVYKSMDDTKYWDGKNEGGTDSPEGVYYYVIDASCISGSFQKEGFIQLIR